MLYLLYIGNNLATVWRELIVILSKVVSPTMSKEKDNTDALASSSSDDTWAELGTGEFDITSLPETIKNHSKFNNLSPSLINVINEKSTLKAFEAFTIYDPEISDLPLLKEIQTLWKNNTDEIKKALGYKEVFGRGISTYGINIRRIPERIMTKIAITTIKQQLGGGKDLKVIASKLHEISFERDARQAQYGTYNWTESEVKKLDNDKGRLQKAINTENLIDEVSNFLEKYKAAFKATFPNHFEQLQSVVQTPKKSTGSQDTEENDAGADDDFFSCRDSKESNPLDGFPEEDDEDNSSFYDAIDPDSKSYEEAKILESYQENRTPKLDLDSKGTEENDPDSKSNEATRILELYQDSRKRKYHTDSQNFYYKQVVHNSFFRPRQTREEYIQELKNNINNYMRDPSNDENRIQLIQKIKEGERNYHSTHLSGTLREALQGVKETLCLNVDDIKPNEESDQTRFYSCKEVLQIIRWALQSLLESWQVSFKDESYSKKQPSCLSING